MKRVAFPSNLQGLSSNLSFHFGHAQAFTIIEYSEATREIIHVEILQNVVHQHGACMRPVRLLKDSTVDDIVVGGIGKKPCQLLQQSGITLYQGREASIKNNFKAYLSQELPKFEISHYCQQSSM